MRLNKKQYGWILGAGLVILFLASRLYNLLAIPIFTDEAIYIRWTQIFIADKHQFFISLTDGKQPLFIWLGYPFLRIIHDPLLGMRLVSVLAGLFTMAGIYALTRELFKNKRTALVASLLYLVYPFSLVYDKLALYDSLLAAFAVWSLYAEVILVRRRKLSAAILLSIVVAGGMLTKSSAFFFTYLLPFSALLFDFKDKAWKRKFRHWLLLATLAATVAVACYSVLRFSPNYHYIADKNYMFIDPLGVWIKHPFLHLAGNLRTLTGDLVSYSTVPFLLLVVAAFILDKRFLKEKILLIVWFAAPFSALVLLGSPRFLFPRYILFMTMPLLVLAAYSVAFMLKLIRPSYLAYGAVILLLLPMLFKDYKILTNFSTASIPLTDHQQLIAGYASGAGVKETADFLREKSKQGPVYVGGEGSLGLMPEGLRDYLNEDKNVTVVSIWPVTQELPTDIAKAAQTMPTYVVFYAPCSVCGPGGTAPVNWPLKQIFQIKKLEKDTFYTLYQVVAN